MASGVKFDLIEFLKLAPKYFLPLLCFSAIILFVPYQWLEFLALDSIVVKHKWIFSLIFIFSASMFISGILVKVNDEVKVKSDNRKYKKIVRNKLKNLSEYQREIVLSLIQKENRSIELAVNNGEVVELANQFIIYRTSQLSKGGVYFDYCLQPIAEKIIRKDPSIIHNK